MYFKQKRLNIVFHCTFAVLLVLTNIVASEVTAQDTVDDATKDVGKAFVFLLGKRFCPRIRQLHRQRIYRIDEEKDYGPLGSLVNRRDRIIKMDWIVNQWDVSFRCYQRSPKEHCAQVVCEDGQYSRNEK